MPDWQQAFDDFCEWRRTESGRKKFGPIAEKRLRNICMKLEADNYDVEACLDHAATVGWLRPYPKDEHKIKAKLAAYSEGPQLSIVGVQQTPEVGKQGLEAARAAMRRKA